MNENNLFDNDNKFIKTFDFKTLYSDIPHDKLKENLEYFVNSVYEFKNKRYLNINKNSAWFTNKAQKYGSCTKEELVRQINYLIDHSYIHFDGKLEKLVIGIPTGNNCASDMANIFLHVYERKNVESLIENYNLDYISQLGDTFRFQDDLINFKNRPINDSIITDIYPKE